MTPAQATALNALAMSYGPQGSAAENNALTAAWEADNPLPGGDVVGRMGATPDAAPNPNWGIEIEGITVTSGVVPPSPWALTSAQFGQLYSTSLEAFGTVLGAAVVSGLQAAAEGSVVEPGWGTLIGGAIGAVTGGYVASVEENYATQKQQNTGGGSSGNPGHGSKDVTPFVQAMAVMGSSSPSLSSVPITEVAMNHPMLAAAQA